MGLSLTTYSSSFVQTPVGLDDEEHTDKNWAASGWYDLWGVISGVVKKRQTGTRVEVGLYAVGCTE
jgi:hypothetical protein